MEDNHAICQQPNAVNYEESYNKLFTEFEKLKETANQLYSRAKQLENTWMLQRADFLFRVLDNSIFDDETKQKAKLELENFLFPVQEDDKEA